MYKYKSYKQLEGGTNYNQPIHFQSVPCLLCSRKMATSTLLLGKCSAVQTLNTVTKNCLHYNKRQHMHHRSGNSCRKVNKTLCMLKELLFLHDTLLHTTIYCPPSEKEIQGLESYFVDIFYVTKLCTLDAVHNMCLKTVCDQSESCH